MFIQDQIKEEIRRDVNLTFTQRNPNYIYAPKDDTPAECALPPLIYLLRWIKYCQSVNFIH